MLATGGTLLHLQSTADAASTTMNSAVELPWNCVVPSTTSAAEASAFQINGGDVGRLALSAGEYVVGHVVNGKPLLPVSSLDQLVTQPPDPTTATVGSSSFIIKERKIYLPRTITVSNKKKHRTNTEVSS